MDVNSPANAVTEEQLQVEETDDSCKFEFIEIVPLARDTDGSCTSECVNGDWSAEVKEENLADVEEQPDDDYQSSGVCSVKDDDDAVPAEVDEQQSYMQAGDVLETLFMNGRLRKELYRVRINTGDMVVCRDCSEVMLRSNYSRHRRRRHPGQSTSLLAPGAAVVDAADPCPAVLDASDTAAIATSAAVTRRDADAGMTSPPAASLMVSAAQSLLQRHELTSVEALCDHVRRNFPDIPERQLLPLVVGAVAGAQLAAAHHFVAVQDLASLPPNLVHFARRSAEKLALWNMGLCRFAESSSGPAAVSGPCHSLEAPPRASLIQPSSSSSHVQYEACSPVGSRYYARPDEADLRLTASTRGPLTPSVCQVSTPGAVVEPCVPSLICTAPLSSVVYKQTPATQRNAAGARQASRVESVSTTSVAARSLASSTGRFASCLPVPLLEAVEGFDVDVVETAAGEARTRPPTDVVAPNLVVHSDPAATASATEPTAVPPSRVIAAPSHQSAVASAASSGAGRVHPGRSSREGRRNRRRPAAGRWGSPSPRRRSPPSSWTD